MSTTTKPTQEKSFSPCTSLTNDEHCSHLEISLAEDYWFPLFSALGFVLRLQLGSGGGGRVVGRKGESHPAPDSAWPWFTSSSNMPAWLSELIKGQDNSNNDRHQRAERPCLFCETEHLEEIFKRQMREQSSPSPEHHSAWWWRIRQPHGSLGPLPSGWAMWEEEELSPL